MNCPTLTHSPRAGSFRVRIVARQLPHRQAMNADHSNGADSGAMSDRVIEVSDSDGLIAEISRLRAHVAQLEERVGELDQLAHQDPLVDLPNRRGFMRELERLVDRARRYGESPAMLFVDLDGLKMINDTFGHKAGDEALIQVAQLLVGGVRRSDAVARIGGDEFGILLG